MSVPQMTPSKKVSALCPPRYFLISCTNASLQVAQDIENLKMESPVKQPIFSPVEKENIANDEVAVPIKGIPLDYEPESKEVTTASTLRKEERDEPILQENPQRFVLFPIKYHEVRDKS